MSTLKSILVFILSAFCISSYAQEKIKRDSIPQKKVAEKKEEDNRNVMLNAANNTGPRDVNIGLPTTVGGITIQENNLPVVYFFWPELPNRTWRQSVSLQKTGLLKIGESVITTGDLGFAVNSYTKLGTPKFELVGNLSGSHFGWLKGDVNVSGPISNGWSYVAGIYQNYDPNSFDVQFSDYSDKTQIYRAGLTKRFKKDKGEISFLYKYANSISLTNYAVFQYKESGQVQELDNFRIGRDSYIINDGIMKFKDIRTGEFSFKNEGGNDAASSSHSFDVLRNYKLRNGWNFNFNTRLRFAKATTLTNIPLGILQAGSNDGFSYVSNGQAYTGNVNSMLGLSTPAGSTVAMQTVLNNNSAFTPNFVAPIYGGFSAELLKKPLPKQVVPMFICAATDDQLKLVPRSIQVYHKWLEGGYPVELHVYEKGGHGFGLSKQNLPVDSWTDRFEDWLRSHKLMNEELTK